MTTKTRPQPPGDLLGFDAEIVSEADLDRAMAEAAWLEARQAELQAECDRQMKAIQSRFQDQMQLVVDGQWLVSFADRHAVLAAAIEAYCNEHQAELVTGKGRCRDMTHGTLSWKKTPEGVKTAEGRKPDELVEEFIDEHALRPRLHAMLESISVCGELGNPDHRTAADFFDVSLALSLTRAKLAFKAGRLTQEHLDRVGLVWDRGADKFSFKPSRVVVKTEANLAEVG